MYDVLYFEKKSGLHKVVLSDNSRHVAKSCRLGELSPLPRTRRMAL